jgi:hypothetical protein
MSTATGTANFRVKHAMAPILDLKDIFPCKGLEKAGPARAGMELCLGAEERQITARTKVDTRLLVIQERATEWPLRPLGTEDVKSFPPKLLEPFVVGFFDARHSFGWKGGVIGSEQANRHFSGQIPGKSNFHDRIEKYGKKTNRNGDFHRKRCMIFS